MKHFKVVQGSRTGPSGLVLAGPLFQGGLTYSSVNKKSNAWLRIGLESSS